MAENTQKITTNDHSIGNILIISLLAFCGLTIIFLLGLF